MNNNLEPVNYDSISDVFGLARRLANENREMHLNAAKNAKSEEEFEAAVRAARVAFAEADAVAEGQKRFLASESSFHTGTLDMMSGKTDAAKASFAAAGEQLGDAAKQIDMFAEYMPKSQYMPVAIQNVAKRDGMLDAAEKGIHNAVDNIALTVKGFASGLKVFAAQVAEFGQRVALIPDQVQKIVKDKAVSVVEATSIATMGFLSRAKLAVQSAVEGVVKAVTDTVDGVQEKAKAVNKKVNNGLDYLEMQEILARQRAWNTIEKCAQYAVELKNEVKSEIKGAAVAGATKFAQGVEAAATAIETGVAAGLNKAGELADKVGNKAVEVADAAQAKIDKAEVNVRAVAGTVTAVAGLARAVVAAQYLQSKTAAADDVAQRKTFKPA